MREEIEPGAQHGDKPKVASSFSFALSKGDLEDDDEALSRPTVLHPEATPPRMKIHAARYFLSRLKRAALNEAASLMYLEATFQALRSATFALQRSCAKTEGFAEWYEAKQLEMTDDPILPNLVKLRNAAEKEGLVLDNFGVRAILRYHKDGRVVPKMAAPTLRIADFEFHDPLDKLATSIEKIAAVVEEAHDKGFVPIPATKPHPIVLETVKEQDDGSWAHFDPARG